MSPGDWFILVPLIVGGAIVWRGIISRLQRGEPVIPYAPRRPVPWDGAKLAICAVVYFAAREWALFVWGRDPTTGDMPKSVDEAAQLFRLPGYAASVLKAVSLSNAASTAVIAILLIVVARAVAGDFGIGFGRLGENLRLAVSGFFAVAVPALLLQVIIQAFLVKSEHAIVLALKASNDPRTMFWAVSAAVVVAPPVEEFLYRAVLQGWFERVFDRTTPDDLAAETVSRSPSPWPIFLSAGIFALMHEGFDRIPLFILALGLGYIYRQTHRLWPCILVHFFLNALSMAVLLVGIMQ